MFRTCSTPSSLLATLAFTGLAFAQQVVVATDDSTDTLVAFSPVDGSLVDPNLFAIPNTVQVSALMVGNEIWISEQSGDRVVRYDVCGNVLGVLGPTLAGGGMDNIRGMKFFGGIVYVTNDGTNNGATADSLVTFDPAGNYLGTIALSASPSPFSVLPFQGDMLVVSSSGPDKVHRYTLAGASVGTFNNSTALGFSHASVIASDGNIWLSTFTTDTIVKLDAATGNILQTLPADNARGIFELQNGNLLWTTQYGGAYVYDMVAGTNTQVHAGSMYNLNLVTLDLACHKSYGVGCHTYREDRSNLMQLFPDVPSAKAALDGNVLQFTRTGNGYLATWLPGVAGALYVPPTPAATVVADASATTTTFTPSVAIPVPGGVASTWTISSEGVLTADAAGNQGTLSTATLANTAAQTGLAWYTWVNQNPVETGSGKIKTEEVGGVLYVTFDGVELVGGTPTLAPSTYQYQINMTTGDVLMVWNSFSSSNSTIDVLVGCTLAGAGATPVSQTLSAAVAAVIEPDPVLNPMTLTASPNAVINPSTLVTYTANDVPEFVPGSGVYIGTMFLSVNPLPSGFDLTGILTTVTGCNAYVASLDIDLGGAVNIAPSLSWSFNYSNAFFAPGNVVASQAVALFDPAFPLLNGEAGGFLFSNGLRTTTHLQ
jgi:hypothetical protein